MSIKISDTIIFKDNFDDDVLITLNEIEENYIETYPVNEISVVYLVMSLIMFEETSAHKILKRHMGREFLRLADDLVSEVEKGTIKIVKPGRSIPMSQELYDCVESAVNGEEIKKHDMLDSLSFISEIFISNKDCRDIFERHGVTRDKLNKLMEQYEYTQGDIFDSEVPKIKIEVMNPNSGFDIGSLLGNMGMIPNMGMAGHNNTSSDALAANCSNLLNDALDGKLGDVYEMDDKIDKITSVFSRKENNHVVVVGESGVGKTALVEGLAYRISKGVCHPALFDYHLLRLNMTDIMSGTTLRGMVEDRVSKICTSLASLSKVILFVDDFHYMLTSKNLEEFNVPALFDKLVGMSNVRLIVTMPQKGYKTFSDNCPELLRKFTKIALERPSYDTCVKIINKVKKSYEKHHNVIYSDKCIEEAVKLSEKYIQEKSLPSSAIDIIDDAGARSHSSLLVDDEIRNGMLEMGLLYDEANKNKSNKAMKETIKAKMDEKFSAVSGLIGKKAKVCRTVTEKDVYMVFSDITGIDCKELSETELNKIGSMEGNIKKRIVGQDEAIEKVCMSIKRKKIGLIRENKPILTCMCIGNTGVGKTLLAKTLAKELFGDESKVVRFDMSEYSDKTAVNKLIGSSAGYIGYNNGGLLTEAVKNNKYCVLLIDEIEKADKDIYNIFLQIFDEGFMTDNTGNKVDFKNTIIMMTSNVGVANATNNKSISISDDNGGNRRDIIEREYKKKFPPEFINRIDETIYFNDLSEDNIRTILVMAIDELKGKLKVLGYDFTYTDDVVNIMMDGLMKESKYGARPILRAVSTEFENRIADIIISRNTNGNSFSATVEDGKIVVR